MPKQHRDRVEFEFDEAKSRANKAKHGIDFVEAQALWDDERLFQAPAHPGVELRFLMIGMIGRRHWSAIIVYRGWRVRVISVRRSRLEEVRRYESQ
jgi:uncharacterized DUF497 family protein